MDNGIGLYRGAIEQHERILEAMQLREPARARQEIERDIRDYATTYRDTYADLFSR